MRRAIVLCAVAGCSKGTAAAASLDASSAADAGAVDVSAIARAEDLRRAQDVPRDALRSHDPSVRRLAARALARIAAADAEADDAALDRALADDDDETIAWAAYGLGESCKGREDGHVRALAARLAAVGSPEPAHAPIDARATIVRAIGRCGGEQADQTLRAHLRRGGHAAAEAAAFALGDVASKRGSLSLESASGLLDRAAAAAKALPAFDAALYPFGRVDAPPEDLLPRLLEAARAALDRYGPARIFAVRALGRAGGDAAADLGRVLESDSFTPAERAEAARALGRLRKAGQAALGDAIALLAHASALSGDGFGVLLAAVAAAGDEPSKKLQASLWAVARIDAGADAPPKTARRASQLRCAAAEKLVRGAFDTEPLRSCDVADGEAGERARAASLDHGSIVKARRAAWIDLTKSKRVRVREAAIEMIERHPELGDAALSALGDALASSDAGVVAAAADVVHAHPDRILVLAESERRAGLDPRAPPPTANPKTEPDARVAKGLRAAMARKWSEDLVETRVAVLDAALALSLDEARPFALAACKDANATVRARAAKALAASGDKDARCPAPDPGSASVAAEVGHALSKPTRVVFDTDAGELSIRFDPALAPVAVTRFVALARSGFYTGVAVHRVVPGFVVQFGDRGGDGYGGSGTLLRCEISPVPFEPLDVGVALAGRDTGSSQVFVALAREPHLDGQYARVGKAEGDWDSVAEGDVIGAVRVED